MLRIGLTGGMGAGKSTVAKIFEVLGVPVYYADEAARRLMNEDPDLKSRIQEQFGREAYAGGQLNRAYLASQVFNHKEKLDRLNALVHPVTIRDGEEWMNRQVTAYAIKEAALIFESGVEKWLDYVIGVITPYPLRLNRILQRDGISEEEALGRMKNQMDENRKMSLCDFLVYNDDQSALLPQVLDLHGKLLKLKKK